MLKNKHFIIWVFAAVIVSIIASFIFPVPAGESVGLKVALGLSLSMCLLQVGAVLTFASSLQSFTHALRRGYYLLLIGLLTFGVIALGLPLLITFNVDSAFMQLFILVFYLGSTLLVYLSMYTFARLLKVRHFMVSLPVIIGAALTVGVFGATGLSYLLASLTGGEPNPASAVMGINLVFLIAATFIARLLSKAIGALYARAMRWLYWGLLLFAFATVHELFIKLSLPEDNWYLLYGISFWPYVVASAVILASSFVFKSHSATVVTYAGAKNHIDVLMSLVDFASRPHDIDRLLDEVRGITASTPAGTELSEEKKAQLVDIYIKVEKYLETEDPLHKFTQEELRSNLPPSFTASLQKVEARGRLKA